MKFRKRAIWVEAEQWFPGTPVVGVEEDGGILGAFIRTARGNIDVSPGDWIVTGIQGDKYSVKPEVFEALYEAVGETE